MASSFCTSTSSSAATLRRVACTSSSSARSKIASSTGPPCGSKIRSISTRSSKAFNNQPSGGFSVRIPAWASAVCARPASLGRTRKSTSCSVFGAPRAPEATRTKLEQSFAALEERVDLVLLVGDLTTIGEPAQAQVLADACASLRVPVCAVLGNHDLHCGRGDEVAARLRDAGVHMLDRSSTTLELAGGEVGIVGTKGFV